MFRKVKPIRELHTVLCENHHIDKVTGLAINYHWVLYSSPTHKSMALSLAENLKRCNKSWRIVTNDDKPGRQIIAQWWRDGFTPSDGDSTNLITRKESKDEKDNKEGNKEDNKERNTAAC